MKRKRDAHAPDMPLERLLNLGPRTSAAMRAVGIENEASLRRVGPLDAYRRLKLRDPRGTTILALYAMVGALTSTHWNALPDVVKAQLKTEAKVGAEAAPAPPRGAGRRAAPRR